MNHNIKDIYQNIIKKYLKPTPLVRSDWLSGLVDGNVYLKLENLNPIGSFKVRGALNAISKLYEFHKKNHPDKPIKIVASSAGNHSQGIAFAAKQLGCEAHIFLPATASPLKKKATKALGAHTYEVGQNFEETYEVALKFCEKEDGYFVSAFNDENIILGQATCALEAHEQFMQEAKKLYLNKDPDYFVCSIGGGGLAAGSCLYFNETSKITRVVGAEHECFNSAFLSLAQKSLESSNLQISSTVADGIAVKKIGSITYKYLVELMDKVITVSENDIYHAIAKLYKHENIIAEGAGGASIAAFLNAPEFFHKKSTIICVSGGNIDPEVFQKILHQTKETE